MLVRPATRHDKTLLRALWGSTSPRDGEKVNRRAMVAERSGERVGSLLIDNDFEVRWKVSPEHRGKGHGKRMVSLVTLPGYVAHIRSNDVASQRIADHAGFDLVEDGDVQVWRAARVEPYC